MAQENKGFEGLNSLTSEIEETKQVEKKAPIKTPPVKKAVAKKVIAKEKAPVKKNDTYNPYKFHLAELLTPWIVYPAIIITMIAIVSFFSNKNNLPPAESNISTAENPYLQSDATAPDNVVSEETIEIDVQGGEKNPIETPQLTNEGKEERVIEKAESLSILKEEEIIQAPSSCPEGNIQMCAAILREALDDLKFKIYNESASTALMVMKNSPSLTNEQKLIFYDYSQSKLSHPEKITADLFILNLAKENYVPAKLRLYEDSLSITSILFNLENKKRYCQDTSLFNTSNFSKRDMERYNNILFKCGDEVHQKKNANAIAIANRPTSEVLGYVSMYTDRKTYGVFGWSASYKTQAEANQAAYDSCMKRGARNACELLYGSYARCIAIAQSSKWIQAGVGDTNKEAEEQARSLCNKHGQSCTIPRDGSSCSR